MGKDKKKTRVDIEWENRQLCSDGNCIGVIGPNGYCKECGLALDGAQPNNEAVPDTETFTDDDATVSENESDDVDNVTDAEWENRRLCSDGNCIGVIGPDGLCKECAKPAGDQ